MTNINEIGKKKKNHVPVNNIFNRNLNNIAIA